MQDFQLSMIKTKLLVTCLNGGRSSGSTVKFGKFYLIVDPWEAASKGAKLEITDAFYKF